MYIYIHFAHGNKLLQPKYIRDPTLSNIVYSTSNTNYSHTRASRLKPNIPLLIIEPSLSLFLLRQISKKCKNNC